MPPSPNPASERRNRTALIAFWGVVAGVTLIGAGILQYLGPPPQQPQPMVAIQPRPTVLPLPKPPVKTKVLPIMTAIGTGSTLAMGAPIPLPIPALLGPAISNPNWQVPRIAPNGVAPMRAYAASVPAICGPHIALLVAGLGDDDSQSQEAITMLPAAVSFGLTPYGAHIADLAALARASGHELILEIPMQPLNPATENAGNEALVMAGPISLDQPMLDWDLSQFQGYAGVTDAIGASQGAGFMNNPNAKAWLLREVADKGLFFIEARQTGTSPYAWNRTADVVIDPVNPQNEAAQLSSLIQLAKLQGNALGILMIPAPNAVHMLQGWIQTLGAKGVSLVPVSALVLPPNAPATAMVSP
jgi:polysaccharide deacetylase 2 family uncharacterized protein YibQ